MNHRHVWAKTIGLFGNGKIQAFCTCYCGHQEIRPMTHNGWVL